MIMLSEQSKLFDYRVDLNINIETSINELLPSLDSKNVKDPNSFIYFLFLKNSKIIC